MPTNTIETDTIDVLRKLYKYTEESGNEQVAVAQELLELQLKELRKQMAPTNLDSSDNPEEVPEEVPEPWFLFIKNMIDVISHGDQFQKFLDDKNLTRLKKEVIDKAEDSVGLLITLLVQKKAISDDIEKKGFLMGSVKYVERFFSLEAIIKYESTGVEMALKELKKLSAADNTSLTGNLQLNLLELDQDFRTCIDKFYDITGMEAAKTILNNERDSQDILEQIKYLEKVVVILRLARYIYNFNVILGNFFNSINKDKNQNEKLLKWLNVWDEKYQDPQAQGNTSVLEFWKELNHKEAVKQARTNKFKQIFLLAILKDLADPNLSKEETSTPLEQACKPYTTKPHLTALQLSLMGASEPVITYNGAVIYTLKEQQKAILKQVDTAIKSVAETQDIQCSLPSKEDSDALLSSEFLLKLITTIYSKENHGTKREKGQHIQDLSKQAEICIGKQHVGFSPSKLSDHTSILPTFDKLEEQKLVNIGTLLLNDLEINSDDFTVNLPEDEVKKKITDAMNTEQPKPAVIMSTSTNQSKAKQTKIIIVQHKDWLTPEQKEMIRKAAKIQGVACCLFIGPNESLHLALKRSAEVVKIVKQANSYLDQAGSSDQEGLSTDLLIKLANELPHSIAKIIKFDKL